MGQKPADKRLVGHHMAKESGELMGQCVTDITKGMKLEIQ